MYSWIEGLVHASPSILLSIQDRWKTFQSICRSGVGVGTCRLIEWKGTISGRLPLSRGEVTFLYRNSLYYRCCHQTRNDEIPTNSSLRRVAVLWASGLLLELVHQQYLQHHFVNCLRKGGRLARLLLPRMFGLETLLGGALTLWSEEGANGPSPFLCL